MCVGGWGVDVFAEVCLIMTLILDIGGCQPDDAMARLLLLMLISLLQESASSSYFCANRVLDFEYNFGKEGIKLTYLLFVAGRVKWFSFEEPYAHFNDPI